MKMLKRHPTQTIEEHIININITNCRARPCGGVLDVHGCTVHSGQPFETFCLTCAVPLCSICATIGHKGDSHDTGVLATMAARLKRELAEAATPLELQLVAVDRALEAIAAELAGVDQTKNAAIGVVKQSAVNMRRATVRFENRGLASIKQVADEKSATLRKQCVAGFF
jgi:hypothetical protein